MKKLLALINESERVRARYHRLENSQYKETSVKLGVLSIIYSVLVVVFASIFGLGLKLLATLSNPEFGLILLSILGAVVCLVGGVSGMLSYLLASLTGLKYQKRLNNNKIWIASLIVAILSVVASVVCVLVICA